MEVAAILFAFSFAVLVLAFLPFLTAIRRRLVVLESRSAPKSAISSFGVPLWESDPMWYDGDGSYFGMNHGSISDHTAVLGILNHLGARIDLPSSGGLKFPRRDPLGGV